jgi:hypothetical protein
MWEKLKPMLERDDIDGIRPFGYGTEGIWSPTSINPCIRFTKYEEGEHFSKHRDGGFVANDDFRSIYTLMVYLNDSDSFEGGATNVYHDSPEPNTLVHSISPVTGKAVVFTHDVMHEGTPVVGNSSIKYILRTDIMFQRTDDKSIQEYRQYSHLPEYQEAERLYQLSIDAQKAGDPRLSTEYYLKAQDIHAQLRSVTTKLTHSQVLYPDEVWLRIFSFLPVSSLAIVSLVRIPKKKETSHKILTWLVLGLFQIQVLGRRWFSVASPLST